MDRPRIAMQQPIALFTKWQEEAVQAGMVEPTAMFLATATQSGRPSVRTVLLKSFDEDGFVFYTNADSRKGKELDENPSVALCFDWPEIGRRISIEGHVERVSDAQADSYFASRSFLSRIGAWASRQSKPMRTRRDLMMRAAYYMAMGAIRQVRRPPYWTGFRVRPHHMMFEETGGTAPTVFGPDDDRCK